MIYRKSCIALIIRKLDLYGFGKRIYLGYNTEPVLGFDGGIDRRRLFYLFFLCVVLVSQTAREPAAAARDLSGIERHYL